MTENEYLEIPWGTKDTIENLKTIKKLLIGKVRTANFDGKAESDVKEVAFDFDRAIKAIEKIQQYRALGTVEELREAMEKQMAKKPHPYIAFDGIKRNGCPNCFENNERNEILYAGQKYCSVCGQRIDWNKDSE